MMIIDRIKEELEKSIKERQEEPKSENLYDFDDLNEKRDELYKLTAERFNRLLEANDVNTEMYSLYKYDFANMDIFGDPYLNCTVHGILDLDFMPDMMIHLLKIAERVCNAVDYKDFKLVKIRRDEISKNNNTMIFDITFRSDIHWHDTIKVGFYEALEGDFDPDNDIFIKNYAKLSIGDKRFLPAILHSGAVNSEIGLITSTFSNDEKLDCHDDETYNKITLAMKTNRENLADKSKLIINDLSV